MVKNSAGEFDQRITLESPVLVTDGLGAENPEWFFEGGVWARVMETPGREFLKGDIKAERKAVFKIRWIEIDSTWRVQWGGATWRIDNVTGTFREGARWLHCTAQ